MFSSKGCPLFQGLISDLLFAYWAWLLLGVAAVGLLGVVAVGLLGVVPVGLFGVVAVGLFGHRCCLSDNSPLGLKSGLFWSSSIICTPSFLSNFHF